MTVFRAIPIGAAFDVRNGATPASGEERLWDGEIVWVTPADLGALVGRTIGGGRRSITWEGFASCGAQLIPPDSLILSIRAPVGHLAIAGTTMCFNQGCKGLVPRCIIASSFAYWALTANRGRLEAAAQGTTFVELSTSRLRAERIPVPDLPTQQAIADFLDRETSRIDQMMDKIGGTALAKLATHGSFLSLLQEYRAALITEAVIGQIDVETWGKKGETDRRLEAIEQTLEAEPARAEAAV